MDIEYYETTREMRHIGYDPRNTHAARERALELVRMQHELDASWHRTDGDT